MRLPLLLALAVFVLNAGLNLPLFLPGESPYRDSIEAGYQGMSRHFAAHPSPWGWNPLQYCGLPTQFTYVPLLHYASALTSWITRTEPAYAYKLVTAVLACAGPPVLLLLFHRWLRSLWWAVALAIAFTFASPLYGLVKQMDTDRGVAYLPWRLHVFVKYGEGPHIAGVTVMLLALMAAWTTLRSQPRPWHIPLTAGLFAAVCLTNWVSALALAICSLLLLLAGAFSGERLRPWRLIGAAVLAYGFACWWLTPTFIRTVAFNWPKDAFNYQLEAAQNWLLAGWIAGLLLIRAAALTLRWPLAPTFFWCAVFAFGYPVLIFYAWGLNTIPESRRYAAEFELFLFVAIFHFLLWATAGSNRVRQGCAAAACIALAVAGTPQAFRYLSQGQDRWKPIQSDQTIEHRIAKWISEQQPQGRVLASGGLRFRLNSWFDLHQVGGAFESGLRNRVPVDFAYQVRTGIASRPATETADAILQMKALGVEYVVVHGPESDEHYRDYRNPLKFEGALEKPYSDGNDWIYRVPFASLAHLVRPDEQPERAHRERLMSYVAALGDGSRPQLRVQWAEPSAVEVTGPMIEGHDVVLAVTHDGGWEATQDGVPVTLGKNALNFLVAQVRPAEQSVLRFRYRGTPEQRGFAVLSVFVWCGTGWYLWRRRRSPDYHEDQCEDSSVRTASA